MPLKIRGYWNRFDRNMRLHFINVGVFAFTLDGGINTVIFSLYMLRLNFGPEAIGQVNAIGLLAYALASLPVGRIGEHWSHRRMVMIGAALCMTGTLIAACAEFVTPATQMIFMLSAVVLTNIGMASYLVNSSPYTAAFTDASSRTNAFALQAGISGMCAFAGSLIAGNLPAFIATMRGTTLQMALPYRYTLLLIPLLLLIVLRLGVTMHDPSYEPSSTPISPMAQPMAPTPSQPGPIRLFLGLIVFFAMVRFLQEASSGSMNMFFNVYMDRELAVSTANIGLIQATMRLLSVPLVLLIPALSKKFGEVGVCIGAGFLTVGFVLPIAFASTWWVAGLGFIGLGTFSALRYATFIVFATDRTPIHLRGTGTGSHALLAGLSFALVGLIGGALIAPLGYKVVFLGAAAITALGTLILWVYSRRTALQLQSIQQT